jgi:hypothetical protein
MRSGMKVRPKNRTLFLALLVGCVILSPAQSQSEEDAGGCNMIAVKSWLN